VLPFTNLRGDPQHGYFSDGLTEDITTKPRRFSELLVIGRNSAFQYKGRAVDIRQVGRELGTRYVLEGSVSRSAGALRPEATPWQSRGLQMPVDGRLALTALSPSPLGRGGKVENRVGGLPWAVEA
jgi:hypothetical protein